MVNYEALRLQKGHPWGWLQKNSLYRGQYVF